MKNQLLDLLANAHQNELSFISDLNDEERALSGTSQDWSVKDEVVHIAAWKAIMSERFVAARTNTSPPDYEEWDAVNEEIFQRHREDKLQEVLEFRERSYQELVEHIHSFDGDDLVDEQRYTWLSGRSLWRQSLHNGYFHPHWHIALRYSKRGDSERGSQLMEETTATMRNLDNSLRWQGQTIYNLACFYALSGNKERAIDNLSKAFSLSSDMIEWSREDIDLEAIWDEPGYLALVN